MIHTMNFLQAAIMDGNESARLLASTTTTSERPWQALPFMKRAARALKHPMHQVDTVRDAETRTRQQDVVSDVIP
jgi:hypothetical protein